MAKIIIDKQIADLRRKKGITQEQLAAAMNVSSQAVSKWESGLCCPDISLLPEIAVFFNVTVDELLGVCAVKDENMALLAEHLIEMSALSRKNGLLSLVEYTGQAVRFPFLKTSVEITITGGYDYETAQKTLEAAAGDDLISQLISDCMLILIRGAHPTAIIKILENRLSTQEFTFLKLKRPDFFPTKEDFYTSIKGKEPLSGNTAILEKFLTHSNEIKGKKLFFSFSDELFVALYGASENVIRMLTNEIDQICVCELAWNFMLAPVLSEEKIVKCQQIVYKQIDTLLHSGNNI